MKRPISLIVIILSVLIFSLSASSQTTEFNYQGSLKDNASQANGSYDFEFRLYDSPTGGSQIGNILTRTGVTVTNGIFGVTLDFGPIFPGADRYLEISVRITGGGSYTLLSPRSRVNSAPYSVKSLTSETAVTATNATNATTAANALQLGGVAANQYVITTDPRMTDPRAPTAGSANYVQNTTVQQPSSNFNISGNGRANTFNALTSYDLQGSRFMWSGSTGSTKVGFETGGGTDNSFFGYRAGFSNTFGTSNAFFGNTAGLSNMGGGGNSFFGSTSGDSAVSGDFNSFFGYRSGDATIDGGFNTFLGTSAGQTNVSGDNNTMIGAFAGVGSGNLNYATAVGAEAIVSNSNSVVLGRPGGEDTVRVPGNLNITGSTTMNGNLVFASGGVALFNSPITLTSLGSAGATSICRNGSNQLSTCSSSLRYKTNINRFRLGLNLIKQLKPITFDWKDGGMHDLGLGAEDVAAIEPLLVTYNAKGEVEGVKYDRIGVVLVNAVREQQLMIERQQAQIAALTKLVCLSNKTADICKEQ
jgi:hypothetical protein